MTSTVRSPEVDLGGVGGQLLAMDFDGTIARTFEDSPNEVNVEVAYEEAVLEIFGHRALGKYIGSGGLRNRAPIEVAQQLSGESEQSVLNELTDKIVCAKLDVLVGEIGQKFQNGDTWPRPTAGFMEFYDALQRRDPEDPVDRLIISSGHNSFIRRTHTAWGIFAPSKIISEESMRALGGATDISKLVKPSPALMNIAYNLWRGDNLLDLESSIPEEYRQEILYVGDDPDKDGLLAASSGVGFVLIGKKTSAEDWKTVMDCLVVGRTSVRGAFL